jgi:tetratricopeptide (TPR) repeat protein
VEVEMGTVSIREEKVVIPTYKVGSPDKNPMFLEKRVYQGSTGKIYPYPSTQEISRTKTDHAWNAVWLENDYIKVMILPELGGRIQRAYDKTNDYDFVYYNSVIKPALVGLTGPWISGGIEFNWPQHHRPTTYCPVDHKIVENADGSKSLIIGDVDQINGTKENTTFTLYPDRAYIEIKGQLYNRTSMPQTFLWWANPAVSVNDYTQSIFPPDVHNVYDHGKRAVSRFPIATGEYYKYDYSDGVDISRYKNIPVPTSYMAEKSDYNFVGGYDYSKDAGLLHVANHHVSPGKKQWTWGCGNFGKAWDRNLTDEDGPYIELMTGMYCDNQPDFSWLSPHEEKVFYQYFMPYKKVGQVKNASIHAVLNTEERDEGLYVCVYGTRPIEDAKITIYDNGKEIFSEDIRISPTEIYEKIIPMEDIRIYDIKTVVSENGKELVSYQAVDQGIPELAEPAKAAKDPTEIQTNEELYLTAQHIEQYRHATYLPDPYYLEGLKRDSLDTRINNAYGQLLMRRGLFEEGEKYFRQALKRLTLMHPNPYDSEPYYNLGLSLFYQEKYEDAYSQFYKATWKNELQEMSFYYLAAIEARNKNYEEALSLVDKGLVKNAHNVKALGLRACILYAMGDKEAAASQIEKNLQIDCFDFVSLFLKIKVTGDRKNEDLFHEYSRDFVETYLQVARDFAESGFYELSVDVLNLFSGEKPMIHYYKGYYLTKLNRLFDAKEEFALAEKANPIYTFPNKLEEIAILNTAIEVNPKGAKAYYYLGCLYYDKLQFEKSIALWEESRKLDDQYPTLLRNLSIAYYNKAGKKQDALECLEQAFALDTKDARVFLELDQLYQKLQTGLDKRLALYKKHIDLIEKRDDLYTEFVTLLNNAGKHKEAYDYIVRHNFQTWEGAEGKITGQFKVALLELAKEDLAAKNPTEAIAKITEALSYPENLGEGRLEGTKDNNLYYYLGVAYEMLDDLNKADANFELATLGAMEVAGMMYYYDQPADMILYQGKALEKLGRLKEAKARYYKLIDYGEAHLRDKFKMDYFAVSMPDMTVFDADMDEKNVAHCYYLMGLGNLGLGKKEEAAKNFEQVLSLDINHQNSLLYLKIARS